MLTGSYRGSLCEAGPEREQQVPDLAEAELRPAGGGVAALEGPAQTPDLRESGMGQEV